MEQKIKSFTGILQDRSAIVKTFGEEMPDLKTNLLIKKEDGWYPGSLFEIDMGGPFLNTLEGMQEIDPSMEWVYLEEVIHPDFCIKKKVVPEMEEKGGV